MRLLPKVPLKRQFLDHIFCLNSRFHCVKLGVMEVYHREHS